eukprot:168641_1
MQQQICLATMSAESASILMNNKTEPNDTKSDLSTVHSIQSTVNPNTQNTKNNHHQQSYAYTEPLLFIKPSPKPNELHHQKSESTTSANFIVASLEQNDVYLYDSDEEIYADNKSKLTHNINQNGPNPMSYSRLKDSYE